MAPTVRNSNDTWSRWPFWAALAVVLCTFPVLWVGGLVTTTKAGMAVPDWPGTYGYNLFLYPWTTWLFGPWDLLVEHGHRLLASLLGMLTIALVVVAWKCDARPGFRWATIGLLVGVMAQGVLGGVRVLLGDRLLAMTHGTTGPLFFAATVFVLAAATRRWRAAEPSTTRGFARLAMWTLAIVYMQIAVGAWLRHMPITSSLYGFASAAVHHVTFAAIIAVMVVWLFWRSRHAPAVRGAAKWPLLVVCVQISLGIATWIARYDLPAFLSDWYQTSRPIVADGMWQTTLVTAHQATGSLLLATLSWVTAFAIRTGQPASTRQPARPVAAQATLGANG